MHVKKGTEYRYYFPQPESSHGTFTTLLFLFPFPLCWRIQKSMVDK